eukprot:Blabericola_migrator_1__13364@NODE_948_length_5913_cov_205_487342_g658_i0_p2_GENE_NODE_948_length_5913_cov_205_487342_g658_i0NODE_948_length_5913_cov_205_487342_g658_i0_p2_ORF_typecomplete_len429_score60_91TPR_16/PF13432_6/3_3e05TPR_21/PF09976_9/4_3e05TPR_19/PF14559_6/0_00036TPR_15/PF13429_6/0_00081TPR_MalT/PF17874_1/42TPR_MalT/PF17874_1/0_017ANAPC3/PF12895_7/0_0013TPR_5/PF12688_7/0_15TPR_5/PF12688_7/17BTAD/PF03704_17/0_011TPR_2/PF07719_17/6_9e02TPR_2/PF07719_17/0_056NARP1/PF12569_8/0_0062TPR_9/
MYMQRTCLNVVQRNIEVYNSELARAKDPLFRQLRDLMETSQGSPFSASTTVSDDGKIEPTAFRPFTLDEVPPEELSRRLNRGEIAPREEWIPSDDVLNKKSVSSGEARERLGFATKIRAEAEVKLKESSWEEASTLFIQGIRLLEYYRCDVDSALDDELKCTLRKFRLNLSRVNLTLGRYRESIKFLDDQIRETPDDGVAMYLRGRAYEYAGDFDQAYHNYHQLYTSTVATDDERQVGLYALHRLKKTNWETGKKLKEMVDSYQKELDMDAGVDFSEYFRGNSTDSAEISPSKPSSAESKASNLGCRTSCTHYEPVVKDRAIMERNLMELLSIYTDPIVAPQLWQLKMNAEFEEIRILKALKKYLPDVLTPALERFGYAAQGATDYATMKARFDRDLHHYRFDPQFTEKERKEISEIVTTMRDVLMGE